MLHIKTFMVTICYRFDSDIPVSYVDNRVKLEEALTRCGWPVSEKDIQLLEREIKQAETYIRQAQDLQQAAKDGGKNLGETEDSKDEDEEADKYSDVSKSSPRQFEVSQRISEEEEEEEDNSDEN